MAEKCHNCGDTMTRIQASVLQDGKKDTFIDRYFCTFCKYRKPGPTATTKR